MAEIRHFVRLKTKIAAIECGDMLGPLAASRTDFKQKPVYAINRSDRAVAFIAQLSIIEFEVEPQTILLIWRKGCRTQLYRE
jgi:hypothetical protein